MDMLAFKGGELREGSG